MDLHQPVVAGLTGTQLVGIAVGVVVLFVLARVVKGLMGPPEPDKFQARMRCTSCGWTGVVPKHKPACRRCGSTGLGPA